MGSQTYLYRHEAQHNEYSSKLRLVTYRVVKVTPKGVWISDYGRKRWVSSTARKRFAHPTEEESLLAYRHRKVAYVKHARARLERAELELQLAERYSDDPEPNDDRVYAVSRRQLMGSPAPLVEPPR
jgi:hypothetical protein